MCVGSSADAQLVNKDAAKQETGSVGQGEFQAEDWDSCMNSVSTLANSGKMSEATDAARHALEIAKNIFSEKDDRIAKSMLVVSSLLIQWKRNFFSLLHPRAFSEDLLLLSRPHCGSGNHDRLVRRVLCIADPGSIP
jgi:hypothetical protein